MCRRPTRSTRTDTPVPYPTLFRSLRAGDPATRRHARMAAAGGDAGDAARVRLQAAGDAPRDPRRTAARADHGPAVSPARARRTRQRPECLRSEEHTSELQSLMRISYAVFCLKKKNYKTYITT